jgi:hypothetical protein
MFFETIPNLKDSEFSETIAEEFEVNALSTLGYSITDSLLKVIDTYFQEANSSKIRVEELPDQPVLDQEELFE